MNPTAPEWVPQAVSSVSGGNRGGGGGYFPAAPAPARGETLASATARRVPRMPPMRPEAWRRAERAAREVVRRVQPTEESERRRKGVIEYVRKLVGSSIGCEVFAFGSVPLKTYLPDGDVDLTVLGNSSGDGTLISDVCCILESEEQNSDAEYEVKDVHYIHAEVRLIKCIIRDIIVDISFNQIGGVCTLCFLEMVDRQVGKNHLFKRSIILIKAWCYHESRILGAHHGLISTYALEMLVLYIFNLFHKSLHGPLAVLYRFLEYFSKFDWDNYCISLHGPVALSSLPSIVVEAKDIDVDGALFNNEFFKGSVEKLFVPTRDSQRSCTKFRQKHLNIIDPLKENNNLGRSVSRANFYRIRSAFSYGAQNLSQILMSPPELIPDEVYGFFTNTLQRHGRGERPDIGNDTACPPLIDPCKTLHEEVSNMTISSFIKEDENKSPQHPVGILANKEANVKINGHTSWGKCFPANAQPHASSKISCRKSLSEDHKALSSTGFNATSSKFVKYAPQLQPFYCWENENGINRQSSTPYISRAEVSHSTVAACNGETKLFLQPPLYQNNLSHILTSSSRTNSLKLSTSGPINHFEKTKQTTCHVEESQLPECPASSLPELSGDLDSHFSCLRQVQYHLEYIFGGFVESVQEAASADMLDEDSFDISSQLSIFLNKDTNAPPPGRSSSSSTDIDGRNLSPVSCSHSMEDMSRQLQDEDQWDVTCQQSISLPAETDGPVNGRSLSSSSAVDAEISSYVSCSYCSEDSPKIHGTGTYIPKMSYGTYKERMSSERARKQMPTNQRPKVQHNFQGDYYLNKKLLEKGTFGTDKECVMPEGRTKQIPMKLSSLQQDIYPNKNMLEKSGGSDPNNEHVVPLVPENVTKQIPACQPLKARNSPQGDIYSNNNLLEKGNKNLLEKGSQLRAPVLKVHLSHCGSNDQGKLPASSTSQSLCPVLTEHSQTNGFTMQLEESVEFGSLGPVSLRLYSSEFSKNIKSIPNSKACAEGTASTLQYSWFGVTKSRPQGLYQLRDEGDFPPLPAGSH